MISASQYYVEKLYPLQDGVMSTLSKSGLGFYLTGGTALSRAYFNHRYSDDLDFFINDALDYQSQVNEALAKLKEAGFFWDEYKDYLRVDRFTTLKVGWDKSEVLLKLDFVNDIDVQFGGIVETHLYHRTDSIRNILSNKLTCLFRFAGKDVADIREIALHSKINWKQAIRDAQEKDLGVQVELVRDILRGIPKYEFDKVEWIKKPLWEEFYADIERIVKEIINGENYEHRIFS